MENAGPRGAEQAQELWGHEGPWVTRGEGVWGESGQTLGTAVSVGCAVGASPALRLLFSSGWEVEELV